jgi:hypothetical protein
MHVNVQHIFSLGVLSIGKTEDSEIRTIQTVLGTLRDVCNEDKSTFETDLELQVTLLVLNPEIF